MKTLRLSGTIAMFAAAVMLTACKGEPPKDSTPRSVRVVKVEPQSLPLSAEESGQIEARYVSSVGFLVSGRLMSRNVDVGTVVKPGDLLAQIDPSDLQSKVQAAQAQLAAAKASVDQARPEEARSRQLLNDGYTPRATYEKAFEALQTAEANQSSAEANLRLAQDQLKYAQLLAPSDGVVTETGADPGAVVQAGQMIVKLARTQEREAVFAIPSGLIANVHLGMKGKVWLEGAPETALSGSVREISPAADPITGTYAVRVALPNAPQSFRLGAIVVGQAEAPGRVVTRIPATALLQTSDKAQVWVVSAPDRVVRRKSVTVSRYETDAVIVSSGLDKGDLVVVAGVNSLADGQKVGLQEVAAK